MESSGVVLYEYDSVSGVIESIVHAYVNVKKVTVPDMEDCDLAQEIRIMCIQALDSGHYDQKKSPDGPYNYLFRTVANRTYNLKRGVWTVNNPPCTRCEHWSKKERRCLSNENECFKMQKYKEAMRSKALLRISIGDGSYNTYDNDSMGTIDDYILEDYIITNLSPELRSYYCSVRRGGKVNDDIHMDLYKAISDLLKE